MAESGRSVQTPRGAVVRGRRTWSNMAGLGHLTPAYQDSPYTAVVVHGSSFQQTWRRCILARSRRSAHATVPTRYKQDESFTRCEVYRVDRQGRRMQRYIFCPRRTSSALSRRTWRATACVCVQQAGAIVEGTLPTTLPQTWLGTSSDRQANDRHPRQKCAF